MSITNEEGLKIILPRLESQTMWEFIPKEFAKENRHRWKYLAMLSLQVNGGWSLQDIGMAFGHPKGHVTRCIHNVKQELLQRYHYCPESQSAELTPQDRNPQWETEPNN